MAMDKMSIYLESIEANLNKLKAAVEDLLYNVEVNTFMVLFPLPAISEKTFKAPDTFSVSLAINLNKLKAAVEDLLYSEEIVNVINLVIKAINTACRGNILAYR